MDSCKIESLLERIAVALERIAVVSSPAAGDSESARMRGDEAVEAVGLDEGSHSAVLVEYLRSRKISIKALPPEDPADKVIDSLSVFLGDHFDALKDLLAKIKRAMQRGERMTESLAGRSQADVSAACQFCNKLYKLAFLEEYQYLKSPDYLIRAKVTTLPKAQKFFGGQWLERFTIEKVRAVYDKTRSDQLSFEYLMNPQIVLPNNDDFEMDVLVALGQSIFWIEAKSGDYQQHVRKYSRFAGLLNLDADHSFMVLTDIPDSSCAELSSLFGMTVCNLQTFESQFAKVLRQDLTRLDLKGTS